MSSKMINPGGECQMPEKQFRWGSKNGPHSGEVEHERPMFKLRLEAF